MLGRHWPLLLLVRAGGAANIRTPLMPHLELPLAQAADVVPFRSSTGGADSAHFD